MQLVLPRGLGTSSKTRLLCAVNQVAEGDNTEQELALKRKEKERAIAKMQQKQLEEFQVG